MSPRAYHRGLALLVVAASASGCAAIWGFQDLQLGDDGGAAPDASGDDVAPASDGGDDALADATEDAVADQNASDGPVGEDAAKDSGKDAGKDGASDAATDAAADADAAAVCNPIVPTASTAVAYQIDAMHSGAQPNDHLSLPLCRRWTWSAPKGSNLSYPLVAGGVVFVTYGTSGGSSFLVALDEVTGLPHWTVSIGGSSFANATAAYAGGFVYTVNYGGTLQAFDAATGSMPWSIPLTGQYAFSSPPTATGGTVYAVGAGSGGTLFAVNATTHTLAWSAPLNTGDDSSPAVTASSVFVSFVCDTYGFATDGGTMWHSKDGCSGGGGHTVALLGGVVYARGRFNGNVVLSEADGGSLGTFSSTPIPAASGGVGYFVAGGILSAIPLGQATLKWMFAGDSMVASAPLVVGGDVVVGSSAGMLYVVDASTGATLSSDSIGSPVAVPNENSAAAPLTGMAAADGRLFVPAGGTLYAY